MRYLIAVFVLSLIAFALMIEPHLARASASAGGAPQRSLQIVQDDQTQSFRFVIEGEEVARLDKKGLHVRDNIEYGGTLADVGPSTVPGGAQ